MNITDLMVSGGFLTHEKPETEGEMSTFLHYFSSFPLFDGPAGDPKKPIDGAAELVGDQTESFERGDFSDFLSELEPNEQEPLLDGPDAQRVELRNFIFPPNKDEISKPIFFHSEKSRNHSFENPPQHDPEENISLSSSDPCVRVLKRSDRPEQVVIKIDSHDPSPKLINQGDVPSEQISTQAPHKRSVDDADKILEKGSLPPAASFASPLAPSRENIKTNEIHPHTPRQAFPPEILALAKIKSQSPDCSPLPLVNEKGSISNDRLYFDRAQNKVQNIPVSHISEAGITEPKVIRKPVDFSAQPTRSELQFDKAEAVETTPPRSGYRQLGQDVVPPNYQPLHSKSIFLPQNHIEPLSKTAIPSSAFDGVSKALSQPSKVIISDQFTNHSLQHSKNNAVFENSFPITAIEQGDPEITLTPQSDVSKSPLQAVLGSEKSHNPILQQIAPKLIDQLVFKRDGKIDIILSPKDLGKVEFSFQSHDKSGLSIVILAERDETAALVRRHIDVLTKEFERLGYSDIDFSCEGQPDQQKSHRNPAKVREDIENANTHEPPAQSRSIITHDYSLSTAVDIRL